MKAHRLLHDPLVQRTDLREQDRPALVAGGQSLTHAQLLERANRLAHILRKNGVARGDRVALFLDNSCASAVSIYGTLIAGGAFVPINPQTRAEKLAFILADSGARVLIANDYLQEIYRIALDRLKDPPNVLPVDASDSETCDWPTKSDAPQLLDMQVPVIPLDLAAIIYTSGSTGTPKGVMQTHQSMAFTVGSLIEYLRLTRNDRILCVLPLSFDYGLYQLLMTVTLGACLTLERSFAFLGRIIETLRTEQITTFPGVPTIFATLIAAHRRSALHFPTVTRVTNTAAALPDEFIGNLRQIFPNALIYAMYGLTECKRVSYLPPELLDTKPRSVGKAIPGTEVYLLSADGDPVPAGDIGILHVRGPHIMAGYWNRPDLTEHMLKPAKLPGERVLCTHDLFRMDDDGFLYFVGRTDDIIKTRGEKVSPVEVENALHRIPGVLEAAVIGVQDALLGEAVCAYVVIDPASRLTSHIIRTRSAALLESFMIPKQIILCKQLPRNPNGKVNKRELMCQRSPE